MRMVNWKLVLPLLAATATLSLANKDSDYYPGYSNPNVEKEMYWKDAINVLQDLDQFSSLYIKYHSCVWSEYGNGAAELGNGCNGDGEEGDTWYMGRMQCFRANAAFTLYGILKDGNSDSNYVHSTNCNRHTYINSFFTNYGIESFAEPLGLGTDEANSTCVSTNEENQAQYHGNTHMEKKYEGYTSVTTGCNANGAFVVDRFQGAFCDGSQYIEEVYNLADFNDALEQKTCVPIYKAYGRDLDTDSSIAAQILANSTACSIREYPQECPDPFGLKEKYTLALEKASEKGTATSADVAMDVMPWISLGFLLVAASMFFGSYYIYKVAETQKHKGGDGLFHPTKKAHVPLTKKVSDVSHIVAFRAASSMRKAKERFQNYAEEEELVVPVEGNNKVLVESGYNAPSPTSSSDESAGNDEPRIIPVQANATPAPVPTPPPALPPTAAPPPASAPPVRAPATTSDTAPVTASPKPASTIPKSESADWYSEAGSKKAPKYSDASSVPESEKKIESSAPRSETKSGTMVEDDDWCVPIAERVPSTVKQEEDDQAILRCVSSVTTTQYDRYGLGALKGSYDDSGLRSVGSIPSHFGKGYGDPLPPILDNTGEQKTTETTKNAEPAATKASSKETKEGKSEKSKPALEKDTDKTATKKEASKSSTKKDTSTNTTKKDANKTSAKKDTANTAAKKDASKNSAKKDADKTEKKATAPKSIPTTKETTRAPVSKKTTAKPAAKSTSKPTAKAAAKPSAASDKKQGGYTQLSEDKKAATANGAEETRKKKRPRMAKLSKALFGERNAEKK